MRGCTILPARTQCNNLQHYNCLIKIWKHILPQSKSYNDTGKGWAERSPQPASLPWLHPLSLGPPHGVTPTGPCLQWWHLNFHVQLVLSYSALQATHNCLLDVTRPTSAISNLAQSCYSPGHSHPIKQHCLLSGIQSKTYLLPLILHFQALGI